MPDSTLTPEVQEFRFQRTDHYIDKENQLRVKRGPVADTKTRGSSRFMRNRIGALSKLLKHRHGGPCTTDDAGVWLDVVTPFYVRAAVLEGQSPYKLVSGWASHFLPGFIEAHGPAEIDSRIDAATASSDFPLMPEIAQTLMITWDEVQTLGLKGFASVDRPDATGMREHKRLKKQALRRAKGVRPRSELTKTADLKRDAACIGVSLRTLQSWISSGDVVDRIVRKLTAKPTGCTKLSLPYLQGTYGGDTFVQTELATNDDTQAKRSA